ncbi:hypothetical protein GQ55_3G153500 [Panicum hallii var. hallii]|uniref:Uncharacterized protein n=1 Tax=Panicum hallii var. hallii TaxID=1504633 RepID=A0A2T7E9R7_9POAL|nr:hypothetical protein GQ55_3G153500 [Panicum hallii var. hallii]
MFTIGASYISLLQAVVVRCSLPYASLIHEICEDGSLLCGVEIQLPLIESLPELRHLFFWAPAESTEASAYEQAALKAVSYLQNLYSFLVTDYSFQGLVLYRKIAQAAIAVASKLANHSDVLTAIAHSNLLSNNDMVPEPDVICKKYRTS